MLEIHSTPKHGSPLTLAEIERKALSTPCRGRRIPGIDVPRREVAAGEGGRHRRGVGVDGRFTPGSAGVPPRRPDPVIQT